VPQFDTVNSYRVYGFYDIGAVWEEEDTTGDDRRSLASTGVGLQLDFVKDTSAEVEVSLPLTRIVESRGEDDGDDIRGLFSVTHRF
jgi:hemolysin activation/secretion protein